jgi:hypothetical protein
MGARRAARGERAVFSGMKEFTGPLMKKSALNENL